MGKQLYKLFLVATIFLTLNSNAQDIPKWKLVELETAIRTAEKPTIFNFWATFCKPCIEELPYFQELVKKYDSVGVQLVLVNLDAADTYAKLPKFAKRFKITAPIFFLDETNADLFCPMVDSKWSGAIPASLFVNNKTGYRKFYEESLSKGTLEKEIIKLISEIQ